MPTKNEKSMNSENLSTRFLIFSPFQGIRKSAFCCAASPSTQYSILRKTISMKMVCGQIQPQNILPKMTVKSAMKTIKASMPTTKMKKSWGQKRTPNRMYRRSKRSNRNNGFPWTRRKGREKNVIK